MRAQDSIAAIATAPGIGAVGIVRVSGAAAPGIAVAVLGALPKPRRAVFSDFLAADGTVIDQGLALYFPAPASFTGEHVLELQGHGGPVVLDLLMQRVLGLGARLARPGEFSERAFLNGKLDLTQTEAIADLIASATATQARLAARSLQGVFSARIAVLQQALTRLRLLLEAGLDFPDEDLQVPADPLIDTGLRELLQAVAAIRASAQQGELVRDGLRVVIAGPPNAGKSSLLNALAGQDRAIVTPIPGTTRDPLQVDIALDGLPVRLIDTAGLRASGDPIEQEGMRRARAEVAIADHLLWVVDAAAPAAAVPDRDALLDLLPDLPPGVRVTLVRNKIDLLRGPQPLADAIDCSALTQAGLPALRAHLCYAARYQGPEGGEFIARRRHLDALKRADVHLRAAADGYQAHAAAELTAEDLRQAQQALAEITSQVSADDLLERIFSEFCIGK